MEQLHTKFNFFHTTYKDLKEGRKLLRKEESVSFLEQDRKKLQQHIKNLIHHTEHAINPIAPNHTVLKDIYKYEKTISKELKALEKIASECEHILHFEYIHLLSDIEKPQHVLKMLLHECMKSKKLTNINKNVISEKLKILQKDFEAVFSLIQKHIQTTFEYIQQYKNVQLETDAPHIIGLIEQRRHLKSKITGKLTYIKKTFEQLKKAAYPEVHALFDKTISVFETMIQAIQDRIRVSEHICMQTIRVQEKNYFDTELLEKHIKEFYENIIAQEKERAGTTEFQQNQSEKRKEKFNQNLSELITRTKKIQEKQVKRSKSIEKKEEKEFALENKEEKEIEKRLIKYKEKFKQAMSTFYKWLLKEI